MLSKLETMNPSYLLLLFTFLPLTSHSGAFYACESEKFETYINAKVAYQKALTGLIGSTFPELAEAANFYMKDQLLRIERQRIVFDYLKSTKPQEINFTKGMNKWLSLSEDQASRITSRNAQYAAITRQLDEMKKQSPGETGDRLREVIRKHIVTMDEFSLITRKLSQTIDHLNEKKCSRLEFSYLLWF